MNWDYSIIDAIQLMIPIFCSFLSASVVMVYLFLYRSFKYRIYYAGFLMGLGAFFFVFFESLVIFSGWIYILAAGRVFHFLGQLSAAYFLYFMMLFASTLTDPEGQISRVSIIMARMGLGIAAVITVIAVIKPNLFISLTNSGMVRYNSPSDFGRGSEGPLYMMRDILLGIYLTALIVISIISLIINKADLYNLLIVVGTILAAVSAIDDLTFFHFGYNFFFNQFHFSRLSVGLSVMIFLIMSAILRDYIKTQDKLNGTHITLQATHNRLISSELKYRKLAEGTEYAVFSLSRDFKFQTYNKKAQLYFNLNEDNLILPLPELLGFSADNNNISRQIVDENLRLLNQDKETVIFHSTLQAPRTGEPEELEFHIEYYESEDGDVEYICRAEKMRADRLIRSINKESLQLSIDNYIIAIDDVTTRLTSVLRKHMDEGSVLMIKMGLQELIINAIEHGNLNISFEEKTKAMDEKRYLEFIKERQADPRYKNRIVSINYELNNERVQYSIRDEGEGFDYDATMRLVEKRVERDFLPHGRGINMAKIMFNKMEYNDKGNEVLLVKEF